ncbi:hypothetical protein C2845_PM14G07350 [Panicum miliaceum]|uniref:Zinc finger GRF-type domain-containing protein n=1 Tax=Panicum miliaceum TaxID=4540 RepID=A0A3L6PPY1_PANMI|nr:hypothetical protein C2845_PM14G07350 [Panicum miliaceum]
MLGAPPPLEFVPPPVMDDVTGLPLILCPSCKDLRLVAFICKWTENCGKRFFKCPRYDELGAKRCRIYMFQDKYEWYLRTNGYLEFAETELAMDGGLEAMDVVPDLVMEEIEQVKGGLHDIQDELAKIKLELVELKNEGRKKKCACAVLFVLLLVVWVALK